MTLFLCALALIMLGGIGALATGDNNPRGSVIAVWGCVAGCVLGMIQPVMVLCGAQTVTVHLPWNMPLGSFSLSIDALSAWFLLPLFTVCLLAAVYGRQYLDGRHPECNHSMHWFFFNVLVAAMAVVVTARNGLLFMTAWEIMSLASFFLVCFEHEDRTVRHAGWVYFVATHLGSAFLLTLFLVLGNHCGTLDFDACTAVQLPAGIASVVFILGVIGFGAKAGFFPMHVWLPLAHPAAPSHVSAVMSGVMIKMGMYGVMRILILIGPAQEWWAVFLILIGAVSAVAGALLALAQNDIKRMLAYCSVENIGIITLGMGIGLLGQTGDNPLITALGYGGALLHMTNHALFKSLLFMGAGSVVRATGTRDMHRLGGVIRSMPVTALMFIAGSIAICGLPPFNGFVSEFMIFYAAFTGAMNASGAAMLGVLTVVIALAFTGGLAVAGFTKVLGMVFLGEPRSADVARQESPVLMTVPMGVLAGLCGLIGIGAGPGMRIIDGPVSVLCGGEQAAGLMPGSAGPGLNGVTIGVLVMIVLGFAVVFVRNRLLRRRSVRTSPTWDCGYVNPSASMQYTSSSYAAPLVEFFKTALQPKTTIVKTGDFFPRKWAFHSAVPDVFLDKVYVPLFRRVDRTVARIRWLQGGRVHLYVLYIALTLLALLLWKLVFIR